MAMLDEYTRNEDVKQLKNYVTNFGKFLTDMDSMLSNVKAMGTKYPADVTEINGLVAAAKTQIQAVLAKY
jgi:hypothetical protein